MKSLVSFSSKLLWSPPWFVLLPRRWESPLRVPRWGPIRRHSAGHSARRHGVILGLQLSAIVSPWRISRTAVCNGSANISVRLLPTCLIASRAGSRTVASARLCLSRPPLLLSLLRCGFRCLYVLSFRSGFLPATFDSAAPSYPGGGTRSSSGGALPA